MSTSILFDQARPVSVDIGADTTTQRRARRHATHIDQNTRGTLIARLRRFTGRGAGGAVLAGMLFEYE